MFLVSGQTENVCLFVWMYSVEQIDRQLASYNIAAMRITSQILYYTQLVLLVLQLFGFQFLLCSRELKPTMDEVLFFRETKELFHIKTDKVFFSQNKIQFFNGFYQKLCQLFLKQRIHLLFRSFNYEINENWIPN